MQYLLLIYRNEADMTNMSAADRQEMSAEYGAYTQSIIQSGHFKAGDGLQPTTTATTVRVRDGKTLTTDGPFAETREQLGGYYLVEAKDLDEAIGSPRAFPAPGRLDRGPAGHDLQVIAPTEIDKIFRDEAGRALATLIRLVGDFDLAEDALQDAFAVGAGALAGGRAAGQSARLAGQCRAQQGDRPRPPADRVSRQAAASSLHEIELKRRRCDEPPTIDARRRHAAADLHLLPSGVRRRGAGRADPAHGLRPDHRAGRARLSRQRGGDGAAAGPRQAEDPARRHSL